MITIEKLKNFVKRLIKDNSGFEYVSANNHTLTFIKDNLQFLIATERSYFNNENDDCYYSVSAKPVNSEYGTNIILRRVISDKECSELRMLFNELGETMDRLYSDKFEQIINASEND